MSAQPDLYIGRLLPPEGGPGDNYVAKRLWVGVGGAWKMSTLLRIGVDGVWKNGFSPAPANPTSVGLRVCRDTKSDPGDPVKTTWTARASWVRAPADVDVDAYVQWMMAPSAGGIMSNVGGVVNVGTANSVTLPFSCPVGETRDVQYWVQLGPTAGRHSDAVYSAVKTADHNNLDGACPVDPF